MSPSVPSAAGRHQLRRGQGDRSLQHRAEPGAEGESWAGQEGVWESRGWDSPIPPSGIGAAAALPLPPLSWCLPQAQLGDSRLNPDVGYLLLHTLCPALYALVEDGLKPFQKDVITGQRKNSPWSVVEASVKTGGGEASSRGAWGVVLLQPGLGMCALGSDCRCSEPHRPQHPLPALAVLPRGRAGPSQHLQAEVPCLYPRPPEVSVDPAGPTSKAGWNCPEGLNLGSLCLV